MTGNADVRVTSHPILEAGGKASVRFTLDGKPRTAVPGEPISSAMMANGVRVFNRHHLDGSPQGIFCANGQCAQCLVLVDGRPRKACITIAEEGMDVRTLDGLPELPADDAAPGTGKVQAVDTDVLIVGAGPAGLSAALELACAGARLIIADDKHMLGGKLSLQTHNFFGSINDCYAGTRGMDIGERMSRELGAHDNAEVWLDSPVVGVFSDGLVGVLKGDRYILVRPKRLLITAGAREKALAFPGCDLPGVYGAGAFQTLVNRDRVKAASRLFIVGGGNVGLIVAYHALQAGIDVLGLAEAMPQCGGYKVHLDKIRRLGVPVWTSHSVLRAEGDGKLESVTIAEVDKLFKPVPGTERRFAADTLLVAVGLNPVNELLLKAREFGFSVYAAGDAEEIAEASAAIFSGRITGRKMLRDMGMEAEIPEEWHELQRMMKARPGPTHALAPTAHDGMRVYPVIRCVQEIPCDPCTAVCPKGSICIPGGKVTDLPVFGGECIGCGKCVAICPGLAITLVDTGHDKSGRTARVTIPWEMPEGMPAQGDEVETSGFEGEPVGSGRVVAIRSAKWQDRRRLLVLEVPAAEAGKVAGIRLFKPEQPEAAQGLAPSEDDAAIVCRCERVTRGEIVSYIRDNGITDFNALKAGLRVGMGPCGGKTCTELVMRIFRQVLGKDAEVQPHAERPFVQEIPLSAFLEEGEK